jgi:hypothetical protein
MSLAVAVPSVTVSAIASAILVACSSLAPAFVKEVFSLNTLNSSNCPERFSTLTKKSLSILQGIQNAREAPIQL